MYGLGAAQAPAPNKYKRWSDNEVSQLLIQVRKKKTVAEIGLSLGREKTSVLTKLRLLASDYYAEGRTAEEIQRFTGLPERDVARLIEKQVTAATAATAATATALSDSEKQVTAAVSDSEKQVSPAITPITTSETPVAPGICTEEPDIKAVLAGLLDIQKSVALLNSKPTMRDLMKVINNIQESLAAKC